MKKQNPLIKIAPSLLSSDLSRIAEVVRMMEKAGADYHHIDVMDGHFVPNLTLGPCIVEAVKKAATRPLDVHLMITDPEKYLEPFIKAGSDIVTFHREAVKNPKDLAKAIRKRGARAGIAIKPGTPVSSLEDLLQTIDLVLVMTVEPGFAGQKFIHETLPKIAQVRKMLPEGVELEVDGGISGETIASAASAGADVFVAASAIFQAADPAQALRELRRKARKAIHHTL